MSVLSARTAFVSGAKGFVGRHMVAELEARGWDVHGCDIATSPGLVLPEDDAMWHFQHNNHRYDLIVHAAASSPHRAAIDREPVHMARNLQLDAAMFDWAVRTGQGRVLYLSSSAAYPVQLQRKAGGWAAFWRVGAGMFEGDPAEKVEPTAPRPLAESSIVLDSPQQPDAAYGWTKLTGEHLAGAARAAGLPVTVVRPFSGYGEDQAELFPFRALVERARRREDPFTIWGDGSQVRDWIHITDVVGGVLAVVESGTTEPVNICTGVGTSMLDLAQMACEIVGHRPAFEFRLDQPAGVAYRVGDPTRFHQHYTPQISLEVGVKRALTG